jgi:hypothetical protein
VQHLLWCLLSIEGSSHFLLTNIRKRSVPCQGSKGLLQYDCRSTETRHWDNSDESLRMCG